MAEAEATPGLTVGTTVGNYRVEHKIGEGGMGAVYLAEHPLLGRKAAVKVLLTEHSKRPDVVTRFFNEAKTAASLRHPSLVEVFDFGFLPDGSGYIVMEYLDGESLAARLGRVAPLPPEAAAELGRQLAAGVGAAHGQGIVHRDLKPDNVFLVPDPEQPGRERVKILDFGIAKLVLPNTVGSKGATSTGMLLGTPLYMAPEQCRGSGQVDHRADIYSVGCILYQMITGRPPFDYQGVGEILAAHLHEPVRSPRDIDPSLPEQIEIIVMRALAKKPEDRYQSMSDLAADLQRFVLGPTGPARPAATLNRLPAPAAAGERAATPASAPAFSRAPSSPPAGAGRAVALFAGVLLVAGAAGGLVWWQLRGGPSSPSASTEPAPPPAGPGPSAAHPASAGSPSAPRAASPGASSGGSPPSGAEAEGPGPATAAGTAAPAEGTSARATGAGTGEARGEPPEAAAASARDEPVPAGERPARGTDRRKPRAPAAPARLSAAARHYQRAIDHRTRGQEAEALLAFRAALRAEGLDRADRDEALRQVLSLSNKFGEVTIESAIDGATITVDGVHQGRTPLRDPLLLLPGRHQITLSRQGYRTVSRTVVLAARQRVPLRFE